MAGAARGLTRDQAARAALLLLVTGAPGLARLLLFIAVQGLLGLDALGRFASDVAVTQLAGFFSGVGVSALVMIRVSQAGENERLSTVLGLGWPAVVWLAAGCAAVYALAAAGVVYRPGFSAAVLVAFTMIMLVRRYLLALRRYGLLLGVELAVLALMLGSLWGLSSLGEASAYAALAGSQLAAALACGGFAIFRHLQAGGGVPWPGPGAFGRSFEFGLGNLVSGGRGQLLVPLTAHLCGEVWSGLVGLMQSLLGLVLLFPRGLAQFHLPDLAALSAKGRVAELRAVLDRFQVQTNRLLAALGIGVGAGWLAAGWLFLSPQMRGPAQAVLFGLLLLALAADQQVIPRANLLMALERSRRIVRLNALALGVLLPLSAAALLFSGAMTRVFWLAGAYLLSSLARSARVRWIGDSEMAALEGERLKKKG